MLRPVPNASQPLLLVHGHAEPRHDIRHAVAKRHHFSECMLDDLPRRDWGERIELIVDTPLETESDVQRAQACFAAIPKDLGMIFALDQPARSLMVRAHALGAEATVPRPISEARLFAAIAMLFERTRAMRWSRSLGNQAAGIAAASDAVESLFRFAAGGTRISQHELYHQGDTVIDTLAETGIGRWIDAVRAHHNQTFRHSLLVTGIAVGFGQLLRMRQDDLRRLAVGGLIHDIGKAAIPADILEKPDALSPEEMEIMRQHPALGRNFLNRQSGFSPEMIDVVAHHHEMLDGSGYPDGLSGAAISDLVRIITVADIFAAMIEERAYKPAMRRDEAYAHLATLSGKLDTSLVRAFEPIALATRLAA